MDNLLNTILQMLEGSEITLEIFFVTLVIALPLGMMAALGRLSKWRPLSAFMEFYIWLMRGTPLMLQLLFVYFALPMIGIRLPDIAAALLAFTLNYAAYFAEIFRAGIQSVPKGQYEAARTLGMNYTQTMRRIILPQVIRIVLPPVSNETINLVKDTSLIYILAMNDLLRVARTIVQREFDMTPFLIAGVFYLAMTFVLTWMFKKLEPTMANTTNNDAQVMLRMHDIHKSFGDLAVLKGIDVEVRRGEVLAIIGPSGSGKSTLLRCINKLETIDSGSIEIEASSWPTRMRTAWQSTPTSRRRGRSSRTRAWSSSSSTSSRI